MKRWLYPFGLAFLFLLRIWSFSFKYFLSAAQPDDASVSSPDLSFAVLVLSGLPLVALVVVVTFADRFRERVHSWSAVGSAFLFSVIVLVALTWWARN
jgi:hypothetical protein